MKKVPIVILIVLILQIIDNGVAHEKQANGVTLTNYLNNLNMSMISLSEMAKQFKQQSVGVLGKCGDEEIRDDIQEKMDAFGQSMKSYAGINESMSLSSNPVELLKIHHKLCEPKFVQIEIKFIEDIGAVLRKCLDKDFIPIFEKMYKIILRAESVFCQSKDEDILNIISIQQNKSSIDTTCIQSLSSHFQSCITSSNEIIELAENPNSWKSFGFGFMDGGSKECGVYDTLQKCIVKIMEPCPDRSTPNLIKFIFQFVYKSVDCKSTQIVS